MDDLQTFNRFEQAIKEKEEQMKNENLNRKKYVLIIILMFNILLISNTGNIRFKHFLSNEIPPRVFNSIVQDNKGFMWFGSQSGLFRFDGYNLVSYKPKPGDKKSISDNYIRCVFKDHHGVLWIGTKDGGLNRFQWKDERFIRYIHNSNDPGSISNNDVQAISEDQDGNIWIGTFGGGVNRLDDKEKGFFTHFLQGNGLSDDRVNAIYADSQSGIVWIGTDKGLNAFIKDRFQYYLPGSKVDAIFRDKTGIIWIGTEDNGLFRQEQGIDMFIPFQIIISNNKRTDIKKIVCFFSDQKEKLWVGTKDGLYHIDIRNKTAFLYQNDPGNFYSLTNNDIRTIFKDKSGLLWFGTYGGGVNLYDKDFQRFDFYGKDTGMPENLSNRLIWALYEDKNMNIWIGAYNSGLWKLERNSGIYTAYPELKNNDIRCIHEDSNGMLWLGTYGNGLIKFNPSTGKKIKLATEKDSLTNLQVVTISKNQEDFFWIGTLDSGMYKFDPISGKVIEFYNKENSQLCDNRIKAVMEENKNNIWIGTYGGGLDLFNPETGKVIHYIHDDNIRKSLSHNRILTIYKDTKGRLWFGTDGGGINRLNDRNKKTFDIYSEKKGLANGTVYGILEDKNCNLWLSTEKGVSIFNPNTGTFKNYDMDDGLQSNEFNTGAFFKNEATGEMFFGGVKGFNSFFPDNIIDSTYRPPVLITGFFINGEQVDANKFPLEKSIVDSKTLTLTYKQNFMFEFASLSYSNAMKNEYKYQLTGYDPDWIKTDAKNRRATYTNMTGGKYTFKVLGSNKDGIWNDLPIEIEIKIIPPFWKTLWFYPIYVLTAGGVAFLVWYSWSKRFLKKKVEAQTKELEAANKQLIQSEKMVSLGTLISGVVHELNNPSSYILLNSEFFSKAWGDIASILEMVEKQGTSFTIGGIPFNDSKEDIKKLVDGFKTGSQHIKNILDELRNYSKKEDAYKKEWVEINSIIQSSINLTNHLVKKTTRNFSVDLSSSIPVFQGNAQRLSQVFVNLIQNACQALKDEQQEVRISTSYDVKQKEIIVGVKDEGVGIEPENLKYITDLFYTTKREKGGTGLGLSIAQKIISEEHGGRMSFDSEPGKGTAVWVYIPIESISKEKRINKEET